MYVEARVTPGARKERFVKLDDTHYELAVREPAERNLANTRVRELIAEAYGVPVGEVKIIAGHRSPKKVISIS